MPLYKSVLPYRQIRIHKLPGKRDTKPRLLHEKNCRERAAVQQWFAQRKTEQLPLTRPRFERGLKDGRVRPAVGGVWVSKRALHEDCVSSSDVSLSWNRFIVFFGEIQPSARKKCVEMRERLPSGTLIARYSETFAWFPGWRGWVQPEIVYGEDLSEQPYNR